MALVRPSAILFHRALQPAGIIPVSRASQIRRATSSSHIPHGDLGGAGGKTPVPPKGSGREVFKRKWALFAGGAMVLMIGMSMMKPRNKGDSIATDWQSNALPTEIGTRSGGPGRAMAQRMEGRESSALSELSGRKGGGMGPFRSE